MKFSKRILSLALSAVMLMSMFTMVIGISASAATVWDGTTAESFSSGTGTETDPYIIMSGSELALMASNVNSGIGNGAYYKLGADIVLNENVLDENYNKNSGTFTSWATPIGTSSNKFSGVFDGDNHTISGMYCDKSGAVGGLFGYTNKVTIRNLKLLDSYVYSYQGTVGCLITNSSGTATIDNVVVEGYMKRHLNSPIMGMFIGEGNANITNSISKGLVDTTNSAAGFIGRCSASTFKNCVNYSTVTAGSAAGFVAITNGSRLYSSVPVVWFTDCINYGNLTATSNTKTSVNGSYEWQNAYGYAGGFVAYFYNCSGLAFERCLNEGNLTAIKSVGALAGKVFKNSAPSGGTAVCYYAKNNFNTGTLTLSLSYDEIIELFGGDYRVAQIGNLFGSLVDTDGLWTLSDNYTTFDTGYAYYYGNDSAAATYRESTGVSTSEYLQSGSWLDDTTLWTVKAGQNPTLTLVAGGSDEHTHSYTSEETKAATCTEKGELTYTCECGDSYTEDTPALGHDYVNGYCSRCGEKDPDATFFNVTVKGRNGNTVTTEVVSGAEIVLADIAPFAYAYEVTGWTDGEGNAIDTATITVTADITLIPTFEVAEAYTGYTVTVEGASNTTGGTYQYNDRVTIVFDESQLSEGQYFGGWVNSYTGAVISYATTYKFYVGADVSIVASIADAETTAAPVIAITDVCDMNGDGSRWSFLSERTVPNGYTYVSSGFIYNTTEITDFTSADNRVKASQSTAKNGQYRLTLNLSSATDVYIIAYLTYTDAEGAEHTVYSGNSTTVHCQKTVE